MLKWPLIRRRDPVVCTRRKPLQLRRQRVRVHTEHTLKLQTKFARNHPEPLRGVLAPLFSVKLRMIEARFLARNNRTLTNFAELTRRERQAGRQPMQLLAACRI